MSNRADDPEFVCDDEGPRREITLDPRTVKLTTRAGVDVRRTLPHRHLRTIGAWCFVDHFGPTDQLNAMSVAAHPHTGIQTVSWLFSGEVEHRDSLGSIQKIAPGELNLMTSGRGIAHSELSINEEHLLHGVQLWTVLPDQHRNTVPEFSHYDDLPFFEWERFQIRLFMGELLGRQSPATLFSPLIGAELNVPKDAHVTLPIDPEFEYGVLIVEGSVEVNATKVVTGQLHYIPKGRQTLTLSATDGAKTLLIGGEPFKEKIVMWWNFVARSHDEIVEMRQDWQDESSRFLSFKDHIGGRIPAPDLPNLRLSPRGNLM